MLIHSMTKYNPKELENVAHFLKRWLIILSIIIIQIDLLFRSINMYFIGEAAKHRVTAKISRGV